LEVATAQFHRILFSLVTEFTFVYFPGKNQKLPTTFRRPNARPELSRKPSHMHT
jgi:hypothetical protein